MHKFFIGPMSKEIVDVILEHDEDIFAFIPSRRQVEFSGGYVNSWTTETFSQYVKSIKPNFLICRDHAGGNQGAFLDNGYDSLKFDAKYFDMIHIDPWKYTKNIDEGIDLTVNYIDYALSLNQNIKFEIATEEAIFSFDHLMLYHFVDCVKKRLGGKFDKVTHLVIQSGTKLLGNNQIGDYSREKLIKQVEVGKKFELICKEHNGDYISPIVIKEKFDLGLDCINIAPEFGYIQTCAILENLSDEKKELFFDICYKSDKWKNWVKSDYDPFSNKEDLIKISGHYVFSNQRFVEEIYNPSFDPIIKDKIRKKLGELNDIL